MAAQIRPLSAELQKAAIEQLQEVPERIPADLAALKAWINQQPHLEARTDDQFLLAFLRGCKYSLEKAKAKLDKFYTMHTRFPDLCRLTDVDAPNVREFIKLGITLPLPTPLHGNGPRIYIVRSGMYPADKYSFEDVGRVLYLLQEIDMFEDDYVSIHGAVFILDFQNATAAHLFKMTPAVMKKMAVYSEQALPLRPKAGHFINTPTGFDTVFNFTKPMLSAKLQKRLFVHGNKIDLLHQHIPIKYMPKEYGGENGSIDECIADCGQKLDKYRDYFKDNVNYGTNEKLRPGKPIDFENMFGLEGSFRKLNLD